MFADTFVSLGYICIVYQFASFEVKPLFDKSQTVKNVSAAANVRATLPLTACNNCNQIFKGSTCA